ncbi:hypothetical protein AgCh_007430 [Apium graveolens]
MGSTPHDQLLIQTSDSFSGLLLFAIGFLLMMVAFVKDKEFQGFFARGCVMLHVAMAVWRIYFDRKLEDLGGTWVRVGRRLEVNGIRHLSSELEKIAKNSV